MNALFHMIILALVYYCVLKHDLNVHHKKALTRSILLAVVAGGVHFLLKNVRLEGFKEHLTGECGKYTDASGCVLDASCNWDASGSKCIPKPASSSTFANLK